jgi:hypothetical protein
MSLSLTLQDSIVSSNDGVLYFFSGPFNNNIINCDTTNQYFVTGTINVINYTTGTFNVYNSYQGVSGNGVQGFQGLVGSQGEIGYQGFQGLVGSQGEIGYQGFQGLVGSQGEIGYQGFQGIAGSSSNGGNTSSITGVLNNFIDTTKNINIISFTGSYGSWCIKVGGGTNDVGYGIAVDSSGNSYVTGSYTSPIFISNGNNSLFQTMSGSGSNEVFVVKYGSTGMGMWSSRISGTLSDIGYGIDVDSSGNSYVAGEYRSPATIYNSDGTAFQTITGSGSNEAFIVKYGSTGMGLWSSKISGSSTDIGYGISVDSFGNSYITGQYTSPSTIYNSDGTAFQTITGSGNNDAFVVKYNSSGMGLWSTKISGSWFEIGRCISVDSSGNSYVAGEYTSPATIYNSDGTAFRTMTGAGSNEAFIVKYGSDGMVSWNTKISNFGTDIGYGIDVDSLGNSYVTGSYSYLTTIFNSDGTAFQTMNGISNSNNDAFVVKYNSSGMGMWSTKISGTSTDVGYGIAVDSLGNSYVTGSYTGSYTSPSIIYNSDGTAFQSIYGSGNSEAFVVKYGSTGMGLWSTKISGTSSEIGYGIAVDNSGNSYVTGKSASSITNATIYNSDGTAFQTISSSSAFVVKLNDGPDSVGSHFFLIDLDNNETNNGKTLIISNKMYPSTLGFTLNIQTQSFVTYSTINVLKSISLVFFNGSWVVLNVFNN